jgi:hypothetical protein
MTEKLDFNFQTVRCICYACGWFRVIGFTGINGAQRALIRLNRDKGNCNLLKAEVLVGPRDHSIQQLAAGRYGFHDLQDEAYDMGLVNAERQYDHLFRGQVCPRCKKPDRLQLGWLQYTTFDFARHKCWRLTIPSTHTTEPARCAAPVDGHG